jgi:hypothetical protein
LRDHKIGVGSTNRSNRNNVVENNGDLPLGGVMGIGSDAIKQASGPLYTGQFRFVADLGKDMSVGEMGITIEHFGVTGSFRGVDLPATDEQAIMLKLVEAKKFRGIDIFFTLTGVGHKAGLELSEIYELKSDFFISIAVQKNINGSRAGIYVLRDDRASLRSSPFPVTDVKFTRVQYFMIRLILPSAELSQGVGAGLQLKKV